MRLFDAAATMNSQDLADRLFEAAEDVCEHPICPVSKHILNTGMATFDKLLGLPSQSCVISLTSWAGKQGFCLRLIY